jgi:ribosomal protein S1
MTDQPEVTPETTQTEAPIDVETNVETPSQVAAADALQETKTPKTTPKSIGDLSMGDELKGRVKRTELFGAFVDVGVGMDGLLHISQLGQNVRNVEDVVKSGEEVTVYVLKVDKDNGRIALSLAKPAAVTWDNIEEGMIVTGTVVKLEKFGAFVDFGAERPGMIHVSEMASGYVNSPSDVLKEGEEVRAAVIKVNRKKRRIDLSIKRLEEPIETVREVEQEPVAEEYMPNAMETAFRKAYAAEGEEFPERRTDRRRDRKSGKHDRRRELDDIFERTLRHGKN